jgi:hypothetical protein
MPCLKKPANKKITKKENVLKEELPLPTSLSLPHVFVQCL